MEPRSERKLTPDELSILGYIQELYGNQNRVENVFINNNNKAVIFVKDISGVEGLCVVLTNVAEFARLENLSKKEICKKYLLP